MTKAWLPISTEKEIDAAYKLLWACGSKYPELQIPHAANRQHELTSALESLPEQAPAYLTFSLNHTYEKEPFYAGKAYSELIEKHLEPWMKIIDSAFCKSLPEKDALYALDYEHESYLYNPQLQKEGDSYREMHYFPDGDGIYIFAQDMSMGFASVAYSGEGHFTLFGKEFIQNMDYQNPFFNKLLKTNLGPEELKKLGLKL